MASNDNTSRLDGGQHTDTIINKNSFVFQSLTRAQGGASRLPEGWLGQSSPGSLPPVPSPIPRGASQPMLHVGGRKEAHWGPGKASTLLWGLPFLRGSPSLLQDRGHPGGQGIFTSDSKGSAPPTGPKAWVWSRRGCRPRPRAAWG